MMLQIKAKQDIKAIDLMASPIPISSAGDIDPGARGLGGGTACLLPAWLPFPVGNTEGDCPEESLCAHFRFLLWLSEEGAPWAKVKSSLRAGGGGGR